MDNRELDARLKYIEEYLEKIVTALVGEEEEPKKENKKRKKIKNDKEYR